MGNLERAAGEENSIGDIRRFFEADAEPLKQNEFVVFWKSLSEKDKEEFKKADIPR